MGNSQPVNKYPEGLPLPTGDRLLCQLTLTEFTVQKDSFNITVGDLFGTANELIYIPLAGAMHSGSRVGIGVLVGGVLGGITANTANQQALECARGNAGIAREKDFGKSLEERVRAHNGLIIPRNTINSISINKRFGKVIEIVQLDGTLELSSEDANDACEKLESWRKGTLIKGNLYYEEDPQGINLGLPSAEWILEKLKDGSIRSNASGEMLEAILKQPTYIEAMFKQFDHLKNAQKAAVLNTIRALPQDWAKMFRVHMKGLLVKGKGNQRTALIVLGVSILSTIIYYSSVHVHPEGANQFPLICTGYGVFGLVFAIPWSIYAIVQNRKMRDLNAIIATGTRGVPETP